MEYMYNHLRKINNFNYSDSRIITLKLENVSKSPYNYFLNIAKFIDILDSRYIREDEKMVLMVQ